MRPKLHEVNVNVNVNGRSVPSTAAALTTSEAGQEKERTVWQWDDETEAMCRSKRR
ncbi:hypothetical protein CERZMDRAFT_97614 [Cercospora zeae-maydis SCOH1-5]|uniref:Uncharacterized protein n=1 Tax=Cercospora zeae-maydis SCOH1-5 TaxID=717836 RepID=A0A6A6FFS3_9PEZI|nr:hypothetical protein CERZMDRAFT_97614 [Cercospora zeae-maydis SCOH1-5]